MRPVTPADMQIAAAPSTLLPNVIVDGKILCANLRALGLNETWLLKQLEKQGVSSPADVFLATVDAQKQLSVYKKVAENDAREPFL